jgi:hypothetical protein
MNTNEFHFYESKTCFCEFKSINNIICFVYILNREYALVAYDIIKKKIINKNVVNKNGGSFNVIPEGSLHARLHHMENADGLTKKGIPVVAEKEGGELE